MSKEWRLVLVLLDHGRSLNVLGIYLWDFWLLVNWIVVLIFRIYFLCSFSDIREVMHEIIEFGRGLNCAPIIRNLTERIVHGSSIKTDIKFVIRHRDIWHRHHIVAKFAFFLLSQFIFNLFTEFFESLFSLFQCLVKFLIEFI